MFIELAEMLRCPEVHEETYCVLSSEKTEGRRVIQGTVGCPACETEFAIADGVVEFGMDPLLGGHSRSDDLTVEEIPDPDLVEALLSLGSSGGYVVLVGSVTRLATHLCDHLDGISFIGINPPPDVSESDVLSLLRSPATIPLRSSMARGVVVGKEYAEEPWLEEGVRVLARGSRIVVADEKSAVQGVTRLAAERGVWVGQKEAD
jgi:uncharacterized protein YbaR (Trm112 family)